MIVKPPHREKLKPPVLVSPWVTTQLQPNAQEWNDSTKQLRMTQVLSLRHTSVLSSICLSIHLQPANEWLVSFQGLPHLRELSVEGVPKIRPAAVTNLVLSKRLGKLSRFGYLGIRSRVYQACVSADCEYRFNTRAVFFVCLFYRMFLLNADLSFQVPRYWAGRMQRRHSSTLATALQASVLAQWYEWQLRLAVWGLDCIL
jgi:hypothetical protein